MGKIPVGETVAHAYGFAFRHFVKLLGVTWAPLVVAIALGLMVTPGFFGNHLSPTDHDAIARQTLKLFPFLFVVSLVIRAMIATGVTELALGQHTGPSFVYFSLGAAVWRFIGAWLLFMLVMLLVYIGLVILMVIALVGGGFALKAVTLAPGMSQILVGVLVLACFLIFFGALMFIAARLTFLIPPVVVVEKKVDLARGWQLTHGNFWRIFIIGAAIFIPLIVVQCVFLFAIYGTGVLPQFGDVFRLITHHATQAVIQQRVNALAEQMRAVTLAVWPYTSVASVLIETLAYGLMYGACAFAYRALVPVSGAPSMRG
ncbi:MAG TPA: hypothetical protein VIJ85_05190 [Rhizomicrobium sp.]